MASIFNLFQKKSATSLKEPDTFLEQGNLRRVMPYGDMVGDGAIQLSFTLPVESSPEAREAAKRYVEKLGLKEVLVAHMEAIGIGLSYFVVYAKGREAVDFTKIKVPKAAFEPMNFEEINRFAKKNIGFRLTVLGATTGTDAHTVGIDAIMNMKGYMGDPGLEAYPCFRAINLRSQVDPEELVSQAIKLRADAILVSKIVTQRGKHLEELKGLGMMLKKNKKLKSPLLKVVGGPRLTHDEAKKLGFDAGFGTGTLPREVAGYLVQEYVRRMK